MPATAILISEAGRRRAYRGAMPLSAYVNNQYGLTISARRGSEADERAAAAHVRDAAAHRSISGGDIGQAAIHLLFRVLFRVALVRDSHSSAGAGDQAHLRAPSSPRP